MQFLSELRAERRTKSFSQMADWLIAERNLRRYFSRLTKKGFIVQENLDAAINFDFLIRKGDDELIGILKFSENGYSLSRARINEIYRILSINPQSQAFLLVWVIGPFYPSISFSLVKLNKMLQQNVEMYDLTSGCMPLKDSVEIFFKRPKGLVLSLKPKEKAGVEKADRTALSETFARLLGKQFLKMKKKKFRLDHRIKACKEFTTDDMKQLKIIFNTALNRELDYDLLEACIKRISHSRG